MKWQGIPTVAEELQQDNYFYNTFARELEKFYDKAMNLAWQQIDAAEMQQWLSKRRRRTKDNS